VTAAIGLRLCGIDDESPGAASPTSPRPACSTTSTAGFAHAPAATPRAAAELPDPGAVGGPGRHRVGEAERGGEVGGDGGRQAVQRARRAAELDGQRAQHRGQRGAGAVQPGAPPGRDQTKVVGSAS
jgi:hypothetical protein